MTNLQEIESAITRLDRGQMAEFRNWYEQFDGSKWDQDIALDAQSDKLDRLMQEALAAHQRGETKPL